MGAKLVDSLRAAPTPTACWVALLFYWVSLHPTLMPRGSVAQGAVSGISVALGLLVGAVVAASGRAILRAARLEVPRVRGLSSGYAFAVVTAIVVLGGSAAWISWQDSQRALMGMEGVGVVDAATALVVAVPVAALLTLVGRLLAQPVRLADHALASRIPPLAAHAGIAVVVVAVAVVGSRDFILRPLVEFANERFGTLDEGTPEGVEQPTSALVSGGPDSLVAWEALGMQGRTFVSSATTTSELAEFTGDDGAEVSEPIRAYVGLDAAPDPESQAALAVAELERTGGFERSVLAVVTTTGTGWVNPVAADALEHLHSGDTAIVGMQYSFLPSWISFLVDREKAADNGRALLAAVHERWSRMPLADRPLLLVYGESLGSYGSEEAFVGPDLRASIGTATATVDGVLWVGPTFANPIWNDFVAARDSGSPTWRPTVASEPSVSVVGQVGDPPADGTPPPSPRVVYLSHPSDPVTWATAEVLWSPPMWMQAPKGYDLPEQTLWFPFVTFVQNVFDLMAGFGAPPGHGHDYTPSIVDGWVTLAPPPGWTATRTEQLEAKLGVGS